MNIQTERLEDHTARFTVEVEVERLENAKRDAAKKLAKRVSIPGFRKGKAPYRVLVNYLGEGAILEDALEVLGNEVYRNALDESDVDPYGPGAMEDFGLEPQPTFKFIVPLRPTVDLGDYKSVRLDYEAPTIDDDNVNEALEELREREAVVEESSKPVAASNRVTVKIRGEYLDMDEANSEDQAGEEGESEDEPDTEEAPQNEVFIDQDELVFSLTEDREPAPGFTEALIGAVVDEEREFEITYPEDEEEYEHLSGRHVKFNVTVKKIENVTLPELSDDFAARVTQSEGESDEEGEGPLTLLELRMRLRENLEAQAEEQANAAYAEQVLDQLVEMAAFAYPEALVHDQIHHLLNHLDNDLRQRGLTLEDYMKVSGKSHDDLHVDYHDNAIEVIERSLTIQELIEIEGVTVPDEDIEAEIDRVVSQFGDQAAAFRSIYDNDRMRDNLRRDLLNRRIMERIAAIARGDAIADTAAVVAEAEDETPGEVESIEGDSE